MSVKARSIMCAAATAALFAITAAAQVSKLGAVGDSLTDEYFDDTFTYAKNWTIQLVQYRGVDMGETAAQAGEAGGTWGEPRRTGYAYNWARYGADSTTIATEGQYTGLVSQVAPGGVTHCVMEIGTNDFSPTTSAYLSIYLGLWSQSQISSYVSTSVANIESGVDALLASGVNLALCNYVDFGVAPATRQVFSSASSRTRVTTVIAQVNQGVELIARRHHLVLIDLNSMATTIFGTNSSLRQFLSIGNVNIQLMNKDTTTNTNPLAGFVDDGAHPHTTLQGVFANLIMSALNERWNAGYALFTDQEILSHAGVAYGGSDTLAGQIGPYTGYFRDFSCLGNFNGTGGVTVQDIFDFLAAWFANDPRADVDQSGTVTVQDIFTFLTAWFAGCH